MIFQGLWLLIPFREPLWLVLLVVSLIFIGFCLFQGCYLLCLNFNFYGFWVLLLGKNKVEGWLDLVGHEFWVWPCLGEGTASLKFRQFKSAVCDAFGVIFCFRGLWGVWFCFVGCWGIRVTWFGLLGCLVDGWGLVIWPNVALLVVNYLLRTCILLSCTCMTMMTCHLTWGVVFWFRLFVTAVPNLGCVGYVVKACTVLQLHWLVVDFFFP